MTQRKGFAIGKDALVEIDNVDLSEFVRSGSVTMQAQEIDAKAWGDIGEWRTHGLRDDSFEFTLMQSFAPAEVNATLLPLFESESEFAVNVRPVRGDAISTTNPNFQGTCFLMSYPPYSGEVGARADVSISLPVQGKINVTTSS